jgi:DivIVA domain-containing protein
VTVTSEMTRLMPGDIRAREFRSVHRGGLNPRDVYDYLEQVAEDMTALLAERDGLAERARRAAGTPDGAEVRAVGILTAAQRNADAVVATAQQMSRSITADGRQRREDMLASARSKAEAVLATALEEASREAGRITSQAPVDARRQIAFYQALAASIRTQLDAFVASLSASVAKWDNDEQSAARDLLDGHRKVDL